MQFCGAMPEVGFPRKGSSGSASMWPKVCLNPSVSPHAHTPTQHRTRPPASQLNIFVCRRWSRCFVSSVAYSFLFCSALGESDAETDK